MLGSASSTHFLPHRRPSCINPHELSALAGAVCASLRRRRGPGYTTATPDTLQRRFLHTGGVIINHRDTITVRLNRRTYSPVLRSADIPDTTVPWWHGRTLHFDYA